MSVGCLVCESEQCIKVWEGRYPAAEARMRRLCCSVCSVVGSVMDNQQHLLVDRAEGTRDVGRDSAIDKLARCERCVDVSLRMA